MSQFTPEELQLALPPKFKKSINQELVDGINSTLKDPEFFDYYRNNLISYTHVLASGKFKIGNYIDAVRYVSYKLMGHTNIKAYSLTFPDKIQRFNQQGVSAKDIASYCTAYHKSKLVSLVMEQTLVPSWVLNQDMYQKALNVQAELMLNANSEKVRCEAANSILNQLKQPETQKLQLDIGVKEDSSIAQLKQSTLDLVAQQKKMLEAGMVDAKAVAHSKIIEGDCEDVT